MRKKILLIFVSLLLVTGLVLAGCAKPAPAPTIELTLASFYQTTHFGHDQMEAWARGVEDATGGRVKVTVYAAESLLKAKEVYDGIIEGIADIGTCPIAYNRGRFPLTEIASLPLGFPSSTVASHSIWEAYKKFNPEEFAETKVLYMFTPSPTHLATQTPVRTLEDLKGMEIRAPGAVRVACFKTWGAVPVSAPMGECYEMLAKGIIQGTHSSMDVLKGYRLAEVTDYVTLIGLDCMPKWVVISLDTWNALPKDIQKIIADYSEEFIDYAGKLWDDGGEEGIEYARSEGSEIITLPPAERARLFEAINFVIEEQVAEREAKGLPAREYLDELLRLKEKYSK